MADLVIPVLRLPHGEGLPLPEVQSAGAAGLDLMAALAAGEIITINFCERVLVPTGLALQLPLGFEAQVRPRSGLALKHGVTVLNSPGTIDADYRGEVKVLLVNFGREPFVVTRGMRIAQLVVAPVVAARLRAVPVLDETPRAAGGFGSTGVEGN
jgi:dUTP pyrophosphatase